MSPMRPPILEYGRRQASGRLLQQWIECPESDPSVGICPIRPSTLKFKDFRKFKQLEIETDMSPYIPLQIEHEFGGLEIIGPTGGAWEKIAIVESDAPSPEDPKHQEINTWEGQIAPGLLIVEEMKRTTGVFMSEVCQAIYQNHFPIDTLKYVYMLDVCNKDTCSFVKEELYTRSHGLSWPDGQIRDWVPGTPEFEALLGTKLGQTVAHLVLGAFRRGTHRISRIRVFDSFEALQLQFAIEEIEQIVPTNNPAQSPSARITRSTTRRQQKIESRKRKMDWDEETEVKKARRQ
ncbi:Beta-glucuronidase [Penicillium digitatum]|uniref:Beta-glucuronidase n=1 Tax=Penicillium digitatum TaxID=36651 RepID=A0A7T6XRM6_PENDI|nr:Beta-glucuronidase [Penicillium digitatum]